MKHTIKTSADGTVDIDIRSETDKTDKLLTNLQKCQSGQCGCPTREYEKLDGINVNTNGENVHITLTAKDDAEIDTAEVEKCLDWMKDQVEKG